LLTFGNVPLLMPVLIEIFSVGPGICPPISPLKISH
jgi:hypothetical protein